MRSYKDLGYKTYGEYLESDHWKKKRKKKRGVCKICKVRGETHLHHASYRRLGAENKKDVMELCKDCHKAIHDLVAEGMQLWGATMSYRAKVRRAAKKSKNSA